MRRDCIGCDRPYEAGSGHYAIADFDCCSDRCECYAEEQGPKLAAVSPTKGSLIRVSYKVHGGSALSRIRRARRAARPGDTQRIANLHLRNRVQRQDREDRALRDRQRLGALPAIPAPPAGQIAPPEPAERTWMYPEPIGPKPYFDYRMVVRKESR